MGKTVGIDLGTTNSVVSVMEGGQPVVIVNDTGERTTPSVVEILESITVGKIAKRKMVVSNAVISSVKTFIGHRFDEISSELEYYPHKVKAKGDSVVIVINDKEYAPEQVSAMILKKLKEDAERYLGEKVDKAVITVPAYFNDSQRQATKNAGTIAGLEVLRIINEPTAAALAYGLDKKQDETILVFDLGGGTFDVSILEVGDGVFEVKATAGDSHLGGDDFDRKIVEWMTNEFKNANGIDLKKDKQALQRLNEAAEKAKIELSTLLQTAINLPFITADQSGPKHLELTLTRAKFEELCGGLLDRIKVPVEKALKDSEIGTQQIKEIVLVGGSTRIPAVQELIKSLTNNKALNQSVNPDEVVAIGAAIQAGVLAGEVKDVVLLDVTPLSLGIETKGGVFTCLIERNSTIPTRKSEVFSTAENNQTSVEIHVLQGERPMASQNKSLGRFQLSEIPPAQAGIPQIEVTFDIDANGILNVTAKEKSTGKEQKVSIKSTTNLDEAEIERMKKEAEQNEEEDKKFKEEAEKRNAIDSLIIASEKLIKDLPKEAPKETKENIEKKITELKQASKDKKSIEELENIKTELEKELQAMQVWMQNNPKATTQETKESTTDNETAEQANETNEDIIDADFKEKD